VLITVAICVALLRHSSAASDAFRIANPDWFIGLTGFGYADVAADVSGGRAAPLYFREYLSGEWGAAIGYEGGTVQWLEPSFVFPDWQTNSTFALTAPFSFLDADGNSVPDFNADGFNIYTSTAANATFSVMQTYEFLNAGTGISQGMQPRSGPDPGASIPSSQYVLRQTYRITNVSGAPLTNVRLFQLLHGLRATTVVVDDNNYGEPSMCGGTRCSDYRFDVTTWGTARAFVDLDRPFDDVPGEPMRALDVSDLFGFVPAIDDAFLRSLLGKDEAGVDAAFLSVGVQVDSETIGGIARSDVYVHNVDAAAFHSNDPPVAWEAGRYGVRPNDNHESGKPSTGVHLSIESGALTGAEVLGPTEKWVAGAQTFALGNLPPGGSATFDVILSVSTVQTVTPKPTAITVGDALPVVQPRAGGALKVWRNESSRRRR
jgi:hypothetical protein